MSNEKNGEQVGNVPDRSIEGIYGELFLLFLFILLLYSPQILTGSAPIVIGDRTDIDTLWYPFAVYRHNLAINHFPLWDNGRILGTAFIGFPHTSSFYPPNLLYTFLPFNLAFLIRLIFHQFIIGAGTTLVLRFFGLPRPARLLGSMAAMVGGWVSYAIYVDPTLNSIAWFPLFLYFTLRFCRQSQMRDALLIPLLVFLQFTGGEFESLAYEYTVIGLLLLFMGPNLTNRTRREIFMRWLPLISMGALLAMVQYLPNSEYMSRTVRMLEVTRRQYFVLGIKPSFYIRGFLPHGDILGGLGYMGYTAFFFGLYAIRQWRDPLIRILIILIMLIILHPILLYWFPPYMELCYHLPIYNKFLNPFRSLHAAQFLLLIVAGFGLSHMLREKGPYQTTRIFLAIGVVFGLLTGLTSGIWSLMLWCAIASVAMLVWKRRDISQVTATAIMAVTLLMDLGAISFVTAPRAKPEVFEFDPVYTRFFMQPHRQGRSVTFLDNFFIKRPVLPRQNGIIYGTEAIDAWEAVPLLRYAQFMNLLKPDTLQIKNGRLDVIKSYYNFKGSDFINSENMHIINLINLRYFAVHRVNLKSASPFSLLKEPPTDMKSQHTSIKPGLIYTRKNSVDILTLELKDDWSFKRNFHVSEGDALTFSLGSEGRPGTVRLEVLSPSKGPAPAGEWNWEPVEQGKWSYSPEYRVELGPWAGEIITLHLSARLSKEVPGAFHIQGLEIGNPDKPIQRIRAGKAEIFLNKNAMDRSYIVHNARYFSDDKSMLDYMADKSKFRIREEVLFYEKDRKDVGTLDPPASAPGAPEKVEITKYRQDRIEQKASLNTPGLLALTDTRYPGWRCFVNGNEAKILLSNFNFRAVHLSAGSHKIEWVFQPLSFKLGLWVSITSIFLWIFIVIRRLRNALRSHRP